MTVEIRPLTGEFSAPAFELATEVFVQGSTLHRTLGIGLEDYREYLRPSFQEMLDEGLSVVAIRPEDEAVVGCLIATDFALQKKLSVRAESKFAPLVALTEAISNQYNARGVVSDGDVVLVDMAAVSPTASGQGQYQRLRAAAEDLARDRGFKKVVGELSSSATQHVVLGRLGHRPVSQIEFASFEFAGGRPFRSIQDPPSLILAEGTL